MENLGHSLSSALVLSELMVLVDILYRLLDYKSPLEFEEIMENTSYFGPFLAFMPQFYEKFSKPLAISNSYVKNRPVCFLYLKKSAFA